MNNDRWSWFAGGVVLGLEHVTVDPERTSIMWTAIAFFGAGLAYYCKPRVLWHGDSKGLALMSLMLWPWSIAIAFQARKRWWLGVMMVVGIALGMTGLMMSR